MLSRFHAITRPKAGEEGGRKIRAIIFTLSLSLFFSIAVVASFVFSREKIESIFYLFIYFIAVFFSYDVFYLYFIRAKGSSHLDEMASSYRSIIVSRIVLFFCSRRLPVRGQIARVVRELKIHKRKLQVNKRKAGSTRRFDQRLIFA